MLIRISLIVAIIAGLAVGALNFVKIKEQITTLQTNLKTQTERADTAERDRDKNKRDLDKTTATLKQTQETLASTSAERDKAVKDSETAVKRATQLNEELTKAKTDLGDAQALVARYTAIGTPEQFLSLNKDLKAAQALVSEGQLVIKEKDKDIARVSNELDKYRLGPDRIVPLPAALQGKIIACDPKWNFVVLDVGEDQGMKEDAQLLVSRNGHFVARVKVTSVQKDRSIANIVPGPSKLGEPIEGDIVIPAYPKAS